ncbi:YdeI/OmpD-associated family protein [Owenweeksia hongkongensis]|uniref:YdeI/OmpD-associated family protein n=1 Tax=Owenweeksia hongkongensis TaxID=253245 RepID=UPI003A935EB3
MNTDVDLYFTEGCGRCPLGGTPQCKVRNWPEELQLLRKIALDCGLTEKSKWGVPCYTYKYANVAIVSAFKDYAALSFFKGALLSDENNLLDKPGENSQAARLFKFTKPQQIIEIEDLIKAYIFEAVEVEKAGLKVEFKKDLEPIPEELQNRLDEDPNLQSAFYSLTPGRQRSYILHISQAKQAKTRESRVEKCLPKIFSGKGFNEY